MGRKPKSGLDYYMCDTGWMVDPKFRTLKRKYGYLAPYTYQILLTMIYKDKGYYLDASDMESVAWDVLEYLQGKYMPDAKTVGCLIADLVGCRLFSQDLYENEHILTSRRIQEEYYNSTAKRISVTVDKRFWILSVDDMKSISTRSSILSIFISDGRNKENDGRNEKNDGRSTQRREEKTRIDEIRTDSTREEHACSPAAAAVCLHFKKVFSIDSTMNFVSQVEKYIKEGMTEDGIKKDISKAGLKHPDNPTAYVLAMLKAAHKAQQPVHIDPAAVPLSDWEQDWHEEFEAMRKRREANDD